MNCDHVFEWSLQCGEVACDKCYITYDKYERKYKNDQTS